MRAEAYELDKLKRELAEAQAEIKMLKKLTAQIADFSFENQALKAKLYKLENAQNFCKK